MNSRVLFVSKPIIAPYRDGSKCFVRELATHLQDIDVEVMSISGSVAQDLALNEAVKRLAIYAKPGGFSPGILQNARAALYLAFLSRAELWHFVFAPNAASSAVGRYLRKFRRTPMIQTVASAPLDFSAGPSLLFGDIVVAQSQDTKARLEQAYKDQGITPKRIEHIPPPAPAALGKVSQDDKLMARRRLQISPDVPLILYPGDLEVSRGAERSVELAEGLKEIVPDAVTVIAYRRKTERAAAIAASLKEKHGGPHLRFAEEVENIFSLVAAADILIFPVDDLYGKVDIPIILLEAFKLGTPVLVSDEGPLRDLSSAQRVRLLEGEFSIHSWLERLTGILASSSLQKELAQTGENLVCKDFSAVKVSARYRKLYAELLE